MSCWMKFQSCLMLIETPYLKVIGKRQAKLCLKLKPDDRNNSKPSKKQSLLNYNMKNPNKYESDLKRLEIFCEFLYSIVLVPYFICLLYELIFCVQSVID